MRLFLAYAHHDFGQLKQLAESIESLGHDTSIGYKLMPAADWKAELTKTIGDYDAVLYAASPASSANEWCRWQCVQGVKLGKPVIPVILQETGSLPSVLGPYTVPNFSEGASETFLAHLKEVLQNADSFRLPVQDIPAPEEPDGIPAQAHGAHMPPHLRATEE